MLTLNGTLNLSPDMYQRLCVEAHRAGISIELLAQNMVSNQLPTMSELSDEERKIAVLQAAGLYALGEGSDVVRTTNQHNVPRSPNEPTQRLRATGRMKPLTIPLMEGDVPDILTDPIELSGMPVSEIIIAQRVGINGI